MSLKKICVVTGSRAEYGLLYWLIKEIKFEKSFKLQLVVTGMHLSSKFGLTYKEIEKDFKINKKINMYLRSDTSLDISRSMSIAHKSFSKAYHELKPDLIIILGDRFEIFSAASAAMIAKIPIAHIHGGEITEGSWDDSIRHCISKMSHLHFTAIEEYKKRVIQLGENPARVFNVGAMGIENIRKAKLLNKDEFEKSINFTLNKKNILITFHPTTLDNYSSKNYFRELLNAISDLKDTNFIFTKTNSDLDGKIINLMIDNYTNKNPKNSIAFTSLGRVRYLSALQHVDVILGNSSSGIIEAPSFKIGTVNIGDRQKGRVRAKSIIDCLPKKKKIKKSIEKIYSKDFQKILSRVKNPYDSGLPSKKILAVLKNSKTQSLLKKRFYDIKFGL